MRRSTASWLSCIINEITRPRPTAVATGSTASPPASELSAIWRDPAGPQDRESCAVRSDPIAAAIRTAARVAITTCRRGRTARCRIDRHPEAGEDRGPPAPGAGRDAEGGLAHRASHGLAAEQAREHVADTLGQEVPVRPGPGAVRVRRGLRHAGSLDQDQRRDRERPGHDAQRQVREVRDVGRREPLRDRADVADQRDRGGADDRDHDARDDQGDQGRVRREAGVGQPEQGGQGGHPARGGGGIDQAGMGHQVPELGEREGA